MHFKEKYFELSGIRFKVNYKLYADEAKALEMAKDICLEQTVEFPGDLVPEGTIKNSIVGQIDEFKKLEDSYLATISYAVESAGNEFTQLLNVVFGNISIKSCIKVESLGLPAEILNNFKGPRFGRDGLRKLLNVPKRPILFTALKPMGLSPEELADLAYKFALGGIDVIKDDHGLANQDFCQYEKRVKLCAEAVKKANQESGYNCIYVPNITAPYDEVLKRAKLAKEFGAGGLLIAPGLIGLDTMKRIADDDEIALPIFSHPAFLGSYVLGNSGISHYALFGQITRLAGADATIYPNYGGRFSFSKDECISIAKGSEVPMGHIKSIFPCPAGGMSIDRIPELLEVYGNEVAFLVGGGLFKHGPNLIENCRYFRTLVDKF